MSANTPLLHTPLHALHLELGAKMMPFAGYEMPVNYPGGIIKEHQHCRQAASLFDVSHMGQIRLCADDPQEAARALETLMPVDVLGLPVDRQRYGFFTNSHGGILDDLMITRRERDLLLVVNAANKQADLVHLTTHIGHRCTVRPLTDRALLALQGPKAVGVLSRLSADVARLPFLGSGSFKLGDSVCGVSRSGYTGEDGFEISVAAAEAEALARTLLGAREVQPAGLGARDTLRLEAGLCLHGHDITEATTPVEAGLAWAIAKVRRPGGARAAGYPGARVIEGQLATGPVTRRVGLVGLERMPVREGASILDAHGRKLGRVTSGTLSPTLDKPIAMAYLAANHALQSHEVYAEVRLKRWPMRVCPMPFTPHRYVRG